MKKLLYPLFIFSILFTISCEDKEEPEPVGTLGITISQPVLYNFNDWWDYATKYEIHVDEVQKEVSSFSGFEVTNIEVEPGARQVGAIIMDQDDIWLYAVQKSVIVQENMVTEVEFNSWYRHDYPTPNYLNEFNSLDNLTEYGNWSIVNSKLYTSQSTPNNHQIEWKSNTSMLSPIRVAIDIETSFNDTMMVGIGLGNSSSNNYYIFFISDYNMSLFKWDGTDGSWSDINKSFQVGENGTMLIVFNDDYFHCYLNDDRKVHGSIIGSSESFDIVNISYYGIAGASFDNLKVYNNNAVTGRMIENGLTTLPNISYSMQMKN